MTVIEVNHLSFRYPQTDRDAIHELNFEVKKGEFLCVVGASGAGKSTLCHALVGLIPHYFLGRLSGEVNLIDRSLNQSTLAEISQQIGLVFQDPYNQLSYTTGTVEEELAYGLENRGISRNEMRQRIHDVASKIALEDILTRSPLSLSGGQVQRVAFGCALILNPSVLVLDECTSQLDPEGTQAIFQIIKQLNDEGVTVIMVDNNMERVAEYADRVLLLNDGHQVILGSAQEVFSRPNLLKFGVESPEYLSLTQALVNQNLLDGPQVTLKETVDALRRQLND